MQNTTTSVSLETTLSTAKLKPGQAVSNFAMERKAGEMQVLVGLFRKQWQQFVGKVDSMGKSLSALSNHFEDLKGPRLRELEKPMERITELQLGNDSDDKRLDT